MKSESINCIAIKAALVKDLGRRESNDENEEERFPLLLFSLFWPRDFHKEENTTFYFILSLLSKLSFQKSGLFMPTQTWEMCYLEKGRASN